MDYHRGNSNVMSCPGFCFMSLILSIIGRQKIEAAVDPFDDRWYGGAASQSIAGVNVSADTALKLSTVWACVTLLAETVATLPLVVYQQASDGKQRATNHPLYSVLHDQPNQTQTAFEFWLMMMAHLLLRGNAYAFILPGARGFADQLEPIHPDAVAVEKLENGRLRYLVQQKDGTRKPYTQDDIFHLRGLSLDGVTGVSVIRYARDTVGLGMAAEHYGSRFFRNDSRPGGVLQTDKKLTPDAANRLKVGWESAHSGGNQHRVAVLEEGMKWQQIAIAPQDAQYLETREFQAEDVCRWFRVPPHMVGLTSKATSWGSGIEQMSIGFVTYTLLPWLVRIKQAISRDLILATDRYFADFVIEGLLRGNITDRYTAYATGVQWGWLSPNEIRRLENMNARPNGDSYLTPLNMTTGTPNGTPNGEQRRATHYRLLAEESAGRLVRKERAAVTRITERNEGATALEEFYSGHRQLVAQTLRIDGIHAGMYCKAQMGSVGQAGGWTNNDEVLIATLADMAVNNG